MEGADDIPVLLMWAHCCKVLKASEMIEESWLHEVQGVGSRYLNLRRYFWKGIFFLNQQTTLTCFLKTIYVILLGLGITPAQEKNAILSISKNSDYLYYNDQKFISMVCLFGWLVGWLVILCWSQFNNYGIKLYLHNHFKQVNTSFLIVI